MPGTGDEYQIYISYFVIISQFLLTPLIPVQHHGVYSLGFHLSLFVTSFSNNKKPASYLFLACLFNSNRYSSNLKLLPPQLWETHLLTRLQHLCTVLFIFSLTASGQDTVFQSSLGSFRSPQCGYVILFVIQLGSFVTIWIPCTPWLVLFIFWGWEEHLKHDCGSQIKCYAKKKKKNNSRSVTPSLSLVPCAAPCRWQFFPPVSPIPG